MQSRLGSFTESCLNTASGFLTSLVAGHYIFPLFGYEPSWGQNFALTCIFTVISVVRSYVWRRVFNHKATPKFDFEAHLRRQLVFSEKTFGPGARTKAVTAHIRKELAEIEAEPYDVEEWVDVLILACDGAWRCLRAQGRGDIPGEIIATLIRKQNKNEARQWPDWRKMPVDAPIEHVRTDEYLQLHEG